MLTISRYEAPGTLQAQRIQNKQYVSIAKGRCNEVDAIVNVP